MTDSYSRIPAELRALNQWVCWRTVTRDGKPTHLPINAKDGKLASTVDSGTWATFEQATTAVANKGVGGTPVYGIGYVFSASDGYTGIDLDSKAVTPQQLADQQNIVAVFDSYTEISPSGLGVHVIIRANLGGTYNVRTSNGDSAALGNGNEAASVTGVKRNGVEIYSTGRYFRFTGNVYLDKPIAERQGLLDLLVKQMRPRGVNSTLIATRPQVDDDATVMQRMFSASNGHKIQQLAHGDPSSIQSADKSGSAIDQAIVNTIQFYTKCPAQIERIWMSTPHAQSRAHKMRRTAYKLQTIQRSFDLTIDIDMASLMENGAAGNAAMAGASATTPGNGSGAHAVPAAPKRLRKRKAPVNPYIPPAGLLGELAQWIYAQAPRPVAEIALAGAVGWMAGVAGRAYNVSGAGLNLYVALLASSGAGKEAISLGYSKIQQAIEAVGVDAIGSFFGPGDFASVPGLVKSIDAKRSSISLITEFGLWLEEMTGPRASPQRSAIRKTLLALYSKSGAKGEYYETAYSDKANSIPKIVSPSLSLIGETTPSTFYRNITQATIEDGFLPRFMIVEYTGPAPRINHSAGKAVLPDALLAKLTQFVVHCLQLNSPAPLRTGGTSMALVGKLNGPLDVQFAADCADEIYAFSDHCTDEGNATDNEGIKNLWARVWLNTVKLAALAAVGVHAHKPVIDRAVFDWARDITLHSMHLIVDKIEDGAIATDPESEQWNDLKRCLLEVQHYAADRCQAYGINEAMRDAGIVNTGWLNRRISKLASFRNDRQGATVALKRALTRAIDNEILQENVLFAARIEGNGKLYRILATILR